MEIVFGVAGLVAAIFVVVFGGRGLIDLRRGRSEKKADQPAVVVTDSSPDAAIEQAPPADAERPAPQTFAPPPEPDPIYRRTFVGRDAELDTLHKAFDQAAAGHGSLAMVVGEPGIGKTSLTEQLAAYVSSNGGKTLVGSSVPDDLAKAVLYGRMAAQQAMAIFAYGEVTRLLEQTIKVQGVLDRRDEATLCDLHLELGEAYLPIDPGHALEQVAPEAFRHAEATGDNERASHACRIALESALRYSGYQIAWSQTYSDWADRADTYARASTTDRVNADTFTGFALMGRRDIPAAHVRFLRAIQLAFELDDGDALFGAGALALQFLQAPKFRDLRVQWAERLATRSRASVRSDRLAPYLTMSAFLALDQGDRAVAERIWGELRDLGDRTGDSYSVLAGMGGRLATAVLDGDFVDAERASADIGDRMEQLGIADSPAGNFARLSLARPKFWMGRGTDAQLSQMRVGKALEGVWLANEGRAEGARNVLASELFSGIASADDESAAGILVNLLEIAVMTGDSSLAATLEPKLAALASSTSDYIPSGALTSFGRVLGAAAALLDRPDDARAYHATGLAACQKIRFRPEIAVLRYQLAELLLDSYPDERAEAVEHLDFAIDELRSMGMTLPLNKAVALKARAG